MQTATLDETRSAPGADPFRSAIHPRLTDVSTARRRRRDCGEGLAIDPLEFRNTLGHAPTSVVVVTAQTSRGPVGVAIGSFVSISLDPPLVGFFVDDRSATLPLISHAGGFCVNVLGGDRAELGRAFSRRGEDRFTGVDWRPAQHGHPALDDAVAWIECDIDEELRLGDHVLVVGRVRALRVNDALQDPAGLVFYRGMFADLAAARQGAEETAR